MKEAYEKMGLQQLASQTQQVIDANKDKQFTDVKKPEESDLIQPVKNNPVPCGTCLNKQIIQIKASQTNQIELV